MSVEVSAEVYERLVGQTLANRYLVESRLGEGAMGAVYKAKHVKVGRAFAVKVLHPRLLEEPKVLQRFEREAELAGRLRHPNVIGVVDVGETPDGLRYMVMDFAEGPDLASMLTEAPFTAQRVTNLTRQMLEGLYHAHEAGLIHRDFKPENVIIERDTHGTEVPRIVDFGIAILREGGDSSTGPGRLTTNGLVLGTPHYMAPEQAVADPIDHRIDLFALGIMVYEMLCGKLPFDGSGAEVARANLLLDPPPISERVPYLDVDPLLEAFARRMMAKKRDLRPPTAKAARDLLDLIGKDRPAAAAALGVPLETANRPPMTTQDVQPVRHASGDGTFPPPIREAISTPAQAAIATPAAGRQQSISTQSTDPLVKKRRGPLIGAAIVGVGIIAGAAIVIFSGGSKGDAKSTATSDDKIAKVETPVEQPKVETPTPPVPVEQPKVETGSATETGSAAKPDDKGSASVAEVKKPATTQQIKTPKAGSGSGSASGAGAGSAKVTQNTQNTTPEPATQATGLDSKALAKEYATVGAQLKTLQTKKGADSTTDLWPRYRFINITKAMATQHTRDEAADILAKLVVDIKARSK